MVEYLEQFEDSRPAYLGGDSWELESLTRITVIFGKNGSGKSVLLRTLRNKFETSMHYVSPERGGEINFEAGQMAIQQTAQGRREQTQENFTPNYRQQVVTRIAAFLAVRGGQRNESFEVRLEDIEQQLNLLLPDFFLSILTRSPHFEISRLTTGESITQVNQLSSGEAQVLTLGLDILIIAATWTIEKPDGRTILIDEPDAHMHPDLQVRFADFICQVVDDYHCQVIVATHSTTLLSALGQYGGDRTSVIYMDRTRNSFRARPFSKALRQIAACLGGHALMGPLFGAPILLVEGDDDCRIWSQVPRHHCINISVVPCGGDEIKSHAKNLEEVFTSLCEPSNAPLAYALLDGDKALPQPNPDHPQKFVRFVKLNCHEAENLYLTDEVLKDLGTNWDEAAQQIFAASEEYGEKAKFLKTAPEWNRQTHDLKLVIKQIAKILDSKNVDWTIRVGQRIGKERPSGQVADFLGQILIEALWGAEVELAASVDSVSFAQGKIAAP